MHSQLVEIAPLWEKNCIINLDRVGLIFQLLLLFTFNDNFLLFSLFKFSSLCVLFNSMMYSDVYL